MDATTRQLVQDRAGDRCEYCRAPQSAFAWHVFHIEHIEARQHVQDDSPENLAFSCPFCNRYKGPNLTTLDARTRRRVRLYHPRLDRWEKHFELQGALIVGRTNIGAATVRL